MSIVDPIGGAWKESNPSRVSDMVYSHAGTPRTIITPRVVGFSCGYGSITKGIHDKGILLLTSERSKL